MRVESASAESNLCFLALPAAIPETPDNARSAENPTLAHHAAAYVHDSLCARLLPSGPLVLKLKLVKLDFRYFVSFAVSSLKLAFIRHRRGSSILPSVYADLPAYA